MKMLAAVTEAPAGWVAEFCARPPTGGAYCNTPVRQGARGTTSPAPCRPPSAGAPLWLRHRGACARLPANNLIVLLLSRVAEGPAL